MRPYIDFLYESKRIDDRIFSLCLGKNGSQSALTWNNVGGYITFGGYNESLVYNNSTVQYSSMGISNNYEVPLKYVSVSNPR